MPKPGDTDQFAPIGSGDSPAAPKEGGDETVTAEETKSSGKQGGGGGLKCKVGQPCPDIEIKKKPE